MANFSSRIAAMAAASPDFVAIEVLAAGDAIRQTTYGELEALAGRIAIWLQEAGVARGDRAAILADNDATWVAAYLGVLRLGAVAVPLDTGYKSAQVRTVLADSGARVLFTTERYLDTARHATDTEGPAAARLMLLSGRAPGIADVPSLPLNGAAPPAAAVDKGDAAVILYTSGTTADPKGVVLTHANLDAEKESALAIVPVGPADAILGVLPLFHALAQMANLLLPLSVGARVVFLETVSSSSLLGALASRGITVFACVPQFFYLIHQRVMTETAKKGRLVRGLVRSVIAANVWLRDRLGWNPGRRFFGSLHRRVGPKMRVLITGGSKFDAAIGRDLYGMGFTILNAYGLTETSGGATIQRPSDRFTTSVGQPFGGVEVKIAATTPEMTSGVISSRESPEITPDVISDGEILIRGPIIMRGYFNRLDATNEALKDGWLYTGDLGRLDDKGRLYITGRKKEIIVLASGKNLYPEEIEAHYRQSIFIKELCILGVSRPGEPSAERLHALVVPDEQVLRERGIVNVGELVRFELESLAVQLPAYKRILSYDISLDPLPRTTTGKIKRREVEQLVHDRAGQRESASRETTDSERAWLAASGRADAMALIATRLGRERVRPDDNLELDLALDSMERVELLTVLEERQGTRVAPDVRATIFSVRQLLEAVEAAPSAGANDEPGGAAELPWATLLASDTNPKLTADLSRRRPVFESALFVGFKIVGLLARVLLRFRVRGLEHVPASGPMLLCPNHQTRWDGFFLGAALPFSVMRQMFSVAAAEYFETPFMRGVARMFNIVPIDPDANLVTAMQSGASGLRLGKALMLFPEGERSIDGDVKKFRKGAAILSAHLDAPIVPIAVDGLFNLWPRGRPSNWAGLLPWRAKPVTLVFGPPMRVRAGDYTEGTAQLRAAVVALLDDIREKNRSTPLSERQST